MHGTNWVGRNEKDVEVKADNSQVYSLLKRKKKFMIQYENWGFNNDSI